MLLFQKGWSGAGSFGCCFFLTVLITLRCCAISSHGFCYPPSKIHQSLVYYSEENECKIMVRIFFLFNANIISFTHYTLTGKSLSRILLSTNSHTIVVPIHQARLNASDTCKSLRRRIKDVCIWLPSRSKYVARANFLRSERSGKVCPSSLQTRLMESI